MLPRSAKEITAFLAERGLAPLARFGQNFLVRDDVLQVMLADAGDLSGTLVLEIGPGLGCLTRAVLDAGAELVAAEVDAGFAEILRTEFAGEPRFHLVEGDCLAEGHPLASALWEALVERGVRTRGFRVLSNLPYQITSPFIAALAHLEVPPASAHLMLQREVADVLRATPGTKNYTPLSLLAAFAFEVRLVQRVPASAFHPRPDVDSAIVELRPRPKDPDLDALLEFGRALLLGRRQVLRRTLPRALERGGAVVSKERIDAALLKSGLTGSERAETLNPEIIRSLWRALR